MWASATFSYASEGQLKLFRLVKVHMCFNGDAVGCVARMH